MASTEETERHNINLSRQVWGELKLRSFQENISASELVAYVLETAVRQGPGATRITRYQPRNSDEDRLGRTVFLPAGLWDQAKAMASQQGASAAGLIDYLLKKYLGILPPEQGFRYEEPRPGQVVRVGEERVYLGENPIVIDWKTGKPVEKKEEE